MKKVRVLAIMLALVLVLASCGGSGKSTTESSTETTTPPTSSEAESTAPEGESQAGKTDIVIALNNNFITLDAHNSRDSLSNVAIAGICEGLVEYDKDLKVQPSLAESYEVSEDGLTYTFKLRQGVTFTDGEVFNAEALKVNVDRVRDESKGLRQARTFAKLDSMETPDEYTVIFKLKEPYMSFLGRLEAFKVMSPKAIKENEAGLTKMPIGTGAFKVIEWVEGDKMVMEKNPDWRNADKIGVEKVTYRFITENGTRVAMLQSGEADIIYPMPTEMIAQVEGDANIVIETADSTVCRYVTMNQNLDIFKDVRVRQALNYAIDKEAYFKVVKGGYATYLNSAMSPILPFYAEHDPYPYDVEKAKALLAEAGYPDGFKMTLWGNNETETVKGMNFIYQQLAQVGIEVEVVPMEEGTLSDSVYKTTPETTELQTWYVSWSAVDPDNAIRSTFRSDMFPPDGANTNYYNNPKVDEAINNGNKSITFEDQYKFYKEAQDLIWEDAVWIFMGVDVSTMAKGAHITGANIVPAGDGIDLREIGIK